MPERPLLIFPEHSVAPREKKTTGFGSANYHFPDFTKQKDRLTPLFQTMQQSFITDEAAGLQPEYVLVIEVIGTVEDFHRAVRSVEGLEWLAEIDEENIEPDDNFYQECKIGKRLFCEKIEEINAKQSAEIWESLKENNFIDKNGIIQSSSNIFNCADYIPADFLQYTDKILEIIEKTVAESKSKEISGRLFLSMSNKQAIDKLLSLWNQWDFGDKKLPRPYGKWVEIFKKIKTIRKWDIQDRLKDTGIINYWKEEIELKRGTASKILFEIELWYRNDDAKRLESENKIKTLIQSESGNIVTTCTITEIRFHAIKAELPADSIEKVINNDYTSVFKSNEVMFFKPVGQCKVDGYPDGEEKSYQPGAAEGDPVIAIFDGAPFANHSLLQNRLIIDDPDDFESYYQVNERKHGTAMASLVFHGELDANEHPLNRPIYFRPVMQPDSDDFVSTTKREIIPKNYFFEDIIEQSVRRLFESENGESPVAPTVKIINLSIGDSSKMFFNQLSSTARVLDWLAYKYKVLFCVSAGNISSVIDLGQTPTEINNLSDEELVNLTVNTIHSDIRNRKILSPADSINSITVGAIHVDNSTISNMGNRIDILPNDNMPSPITAHGLGRNNSIKPEIYIAGGKQLFESSGNEYSVSKSGMSPGQLVATTPVNLGEINRSVYTRGTSNATALATRFAARIYEMLNNLISDNNANINDDNIAVLLKALLVHSSSWNESATIYESLLKTPENKKQFKKLLARYLGYGVPAINRVLECTSERATAIGYGIIKKDEKHDFLFPIPPSLSGNPLKRRLTFTLAWFSPINTENKRYRKANLSIELDNTIGTNRINSDWQQVKNGTVQHEVLEGEGVIAIQEGDHILSSVVCREDAGILDDEIAFGLAITLETAEGTGIPIYDEIKERISIPIAVEDQI